MNAKKTTFALFFGNRGFFPASLLASAREELCETLKGLGHDTLVLDADLTRYGAVETPREGDIYANFLRQHRGQFGGVILCLPNFGDENGAVAALRDADVPILVHAYPDELTKMAPEQRRDAFCGKFSIMDVFCQCDIRFTALQPHVVHPGSPRFAQGIDEFDRICRVVNGMRRTVIGAIGARTTAFKTVRIDELTLERHGITVETFDLSALVARVAELGADACEVKSKRDTLRDSSNWEATPDEALTTLAKLNVALDEMIAEYRLDAFALRCWPEMQEQLGVSPCVVMGALGESGCCAACEVDVGNAVTMRALALAAGQPATILDWNNNYGDEDDKCILLHCGPVPPSMMRGKGRVVDHAILMNAIGEGRSYGSNVGRLDAFPFTYGGLMTEDGEMNFYLGEGRFTDDPVPDAFFGCAGVAEVHELQSVLQALGYAGHRHHVSLTRGHVQDAVLDAFEHYLGYNVLSF